MPRFLTLWPGRFAVALLAVLLGGAARGASFELGSTNIALNPMGGYVTAPFGFDPTPGQFRGGIVPSRFVIQDFAAEVGGTSLTPKQRRFHEITGSFTWAQADADARRRGGHLAVITSAAENQEMLAALPANPGLDAVWIGGTDEGTEGQWRWITGESFVFQNWNGGEPNNFAGVEHRLMLYRFAGGNGLWNDASGNTLLAGYVLEIESNTGVFRGGDGAGFLFVQSALVGMPYVAKASEFLIGSLIPPPSIDEKEQLLSARATPLAPADYWEAIPNNIDATKDSNQLEYGRFYYSETKDVVFATAAGGTRIQWIKRQSEIPKKEDGQPYPVGTTPDPTLWKDRGGVYHRIFTRDYVISASPVKRPRRIYHTEGEGAQGVAVYVPSTRIADLRVVYHKDFPQQMPVGQGTPVLKAGGVGSSDPNASQGSAEIRDTLFYSESQNVLRAANKQGRVFVELIGPANPATGKAEHLGFEIVDVIASATPSQSAAELGDALKQPTLSGDASTLLYPRVANIPEGNSFVYRHNPSGSDLEVTLYAVRETRNANDLSVWWMIQGEQGILWPEELHRYELDWPTNPARYSHYVRPEVVTEDEAKETAVLMPRSNSPRIEYQDDEGHPRAKFTQDYHFYSFLNQEVPAHRTLLSFKSGTQVVFERIFSWLQTTLASDHWSDTVADQLETWRPVEVVVNGVTNTVHQMIWSNPLKMPRQLAQTVNVGQRIEPPEVDPSGLYPYLAGYLQVDDQRYDLYDRYSYQDPFQAGFEEAAKGAIIPVNAIPGRKQLKVLWFRRNEVPPNAGFENIYWPSIVGTYTLRWPHEDPNWRAGRDTAIVLASNDGTGPLPSLEAKGSIYVQNNSALPGYNPNEEHALMIGGQAYAIRDDLNLLSASNYSSDPYVLISYPDETSRPNMRAYRVYREDDADTFVIPIVAGTVIQPPMPLPLLPPPIPGTALRDDFLNLGENDLAVNLNRLIVPVQLQASTYGNVDGRWNLVAADGLLYGDYAPLFLEPPNSADPTLYFLGNAIHWQSQIDGFVSEYPIVRLPSPDPEFVTANQVRYTFSDLDTNLLAAVVVNDGVVIGDRVGRRSYRLTVVSKDAPQHKLVLSYAATDFGSGLTGRALFDSIRGQLVLPSKNVAHRALDALQNYILSSDRLPPTLATSDSRFARYELPVLKDRKGNFWAYRGPHLDTDDGASIQSHWFYRTQEGFFFPSLATQPEVGSLAPYLRPRNPDGTWEGPVFIDQSTTDVASFPVTYRIRWPDSAPELRPGQTLAKPIFGLPGIRGNTSAQIVYEQSVARTDSNDRSATLLDPTREKQYDLIATGGLPKIPDSIRTTQYRGRTYFPNLAPHLVDRFFLDPNRGKLGALVFKGIFEDSPVGEDYFLLNTAFGADLSALKKLVDPADPLKSAWERAIDGLTAKVETFVEDRQKRGTYKVDRTVNRTIGQLVEIDNDDTAVDSYALSANAPGRGYISIITGDGLAFTPPDEPVSVHIIKVGGPLHRGEVKPITGSNPLAEKLTMMHTADLAAATDQFEYDWRIAAPVDGAPAPVYEKQHNTLATSDWQELPSLQAGEARGSLPADNSGRWGNLALGAAVTVVDRMKAATVNYLSDLGQELEVVLPPGQRFAVGDSVRLEGFVPAELNGVYPVSAVSGSAIRLPMETAPGSMQIAGIVSEVASATGAQSLVRGRFTLAAGQEWDDLHISLDAAPQLAFRVWVNGAIVAVRGWPGEEDTATVPEPYGFESLPLVYRVDSSVVKPGTHQLVVELRSTADSGAQLAFDVKVEANRWLDHPNLAGSKWLSRETIAGDLRRIILGESADVQALSDNYLIVRYRAIDPNHSTRFDDAGHPIDGWSKWTDPALAEGWIKRVLAGINPFNQRVTDLFANRVDTSASILTQAGPRWEGDVALSLANINDFGLIEIYETVMNRGRMLSVDAGINYGPANDALLLAAGYLNDLYMMLGNEAWADAANPTIGIGSKDGTYGSIATALFAFKGQLPSLMEEELALLRGRDDFLQPGTRTPPVYNRLFWNYTRGIDSGEVIYALNYNILEDNDQGVDGVINADDARKMFPQGHGDAYGHYLTAAKGYYRLLLSKDFTWVPRTEAVNILGKPVQVDYTDERKFAAAAAAVARTGKQVVDLTWRRDYEPRGSSTNDITWDTTFASTRGNSQTGVTRYWGVDHWASRVAQGDLIHWVVGNAMLPEVDPDPNHEGIQKIDRTTVPELMEFPTLMESLQVSMDNAEAGLNPLGLPEDTVPMDVASPTVTTIEYYIDGSTHFEQVYRRALVALRNAGASFDDAKDVTQIMRSEQDSLADFQTEVSNQELAYKHSLIELYGTPYADDMGPGKTYSSDYDGPDFFHFMYVDTVRQDLENATHANPTAPYTQRIDVQQYPASWFGDAKTSFSWVKKGLYPSGTTDARASTNYIEYNLDGHGFLTKPATWTGRRASPGEIQKAISDVVLAHNEAYEALKAHDALKYQLDRMMEVFENKVTAHESVRGYEHSLMIARETQRWVKFAANSGVEWGQLLYELSDKGQEAAKQAVPTATIAGVAFGGDMLSAVRATITMGQAATKGAWDVAKQAIKSGLEAFENAVETSDSAVKYHDIGPTDWTQELRQSVYELDMQLGNVQASMYTIYGKLQNLTAAYEAYRSAVSRGDRIQAEREVFRKRAAAVTQGFRTRDAAFRIFRNEKLERYKTLQDTASRYAYLAAKAYDYETGLLGSAEGKRFLSRIIASRALGVMQDGNPQFAGSNTGDPGLSSVLAEMKADFDVVFGRLGLNSPQLMGTTASLRTENWRILPTEEGDTAWHDVLQAGRTPDVMSDPDVRRHCLGLDGSTGVPVPGIILEFATAIEPGMNLFGQKLSAGDHAFEASYFATKFVGAGVALEGYIGMDGGDASTTVVGLGGGQSPAGSLTEYLNPKGLSANPYVYLVPVGLDMMRSPALGDVGAVRTWNVQDVAIPLPFNIGGSDFSTKPLWTSGDSLSEPMFTLRKHPAFRPVPSGDMFSTEWPGIQEYVVSPRLIGRSVWNSKWKLVIPGNRLLNDPDEGLNRFLATVKDIKIHFKTYSYAGN